MAKKAMINKQQLDALAVVLDVAESHVEYDLVQLGDLIDVLIAALLHELRHYLLAIAATQPIARPTPRRKP